MLFLFYMSSFNQVAKQLLFCMDFRYITDVLTDGGACEILQNGLLGKKEREQQMLKHGYLTYTRSCAWLGYSDQQLKHALRKGWTMFKVKVGADLQDDICRRRFVRKMIGADKITMLDANQQWEIKEAIEWVTKPAEFKPLWIKEPAFPDEGMHVQRGHATISKALELLGIGVATREHCHNQVIFKQFLQAKALSYLQIGSSRLGSVNENLSVLLMAKKFQSKSGLGDLCELVQHLIIFHYIPVSESLESKLIM
ncbi:mitochondrial enolase superfamily member 1 [Larus michahellis]|uniref:mitochondrial enolase superfamily member 1 n=1 Tax=Larus michahellis TaxID=119627 RepID=UPI003D9B815D